MIDPLKEQGWPDVRKTCKGKEPPPDCGHNNGGSLSSLGLLNTLLTEPSCDSVVELFSSPSEVAKYNRL
jgi:hypothetical protein